MIQLSCLRTPHPPILLSTARRSLGVKQPSRRFISFTTPKMGISNYASQDGEFRRKDASFRNHIEVGGKYAPEKDRYHLYISWACPWGTYPVPRPPKVAIPAPIPSLNCNCYPAQPDLASLGRLLSIHNSLSNNGRPRTKRSPGNHPPHRGALPHGRQRLAVRYFL